MKKTGAGRLILSGANTYTGDTIIDQGTVEIAGANDVLGSTGKVVLQGGGLTSDSTRPINKTVLIGSGKSSVAGGITVPHLDFNPGAAVFVDGTFTVDVDPVALNGGIIALGGNGEGLLTVPGLNGAGRIQLEGSGKIVFSGAADLSQISVEVTPGALARIAKTLSNTSVASSTVFDYNSTTLAGVSEVSGSSAVIKVSLKTESNETVSLVRQRSTYSGLALTPNQKAFAVALDRQLSHLNAGDNVDALLAKLDALTTASELDQVLAKASPGGSYASLYSVAVKRSLAVTASLDSHLENLTAAAGSDSSVSFGVKSVVAGMLTPSSNTHAAVDTDWTAWTSGYTTQLSIDPDAAAGFGKTRSDDNGASLGVERKFGNLRVGVLAALGQGDTTFEPNVKVDADHWNIGGYGSVAFGSVTVDASALWGNSDNKARREDGLGGSLRGDFSSTDAQLGLGVAVNLTSPSSGWQVTPVARLKYISYSQDAFTETGTGLLPAAVDKLSENTVISKVGLRVGRHLEVSKGVNLSADGAVYWVHDYNVEGKALGLQLAGVSNSNYTATGRKSDADTAQFSLGLQATFSDAFTMRVSGQQDMGSNRSQSTGILSFAVNF